MQERAVDDDDEVAISRKSAEINPYTKRLMLEIAKDTEFMASIKHPEYTHEENRAFFNYTSAKEEVSWKKKRRGLEEKELAIAEICSSRHG